MGLVRLIRRHWKLALTVKLLILAVSVFALGQISVSTDPTGSLVRLDSLALGQQGSARIRLAHYGTVSLDPASIATVTRGSVTFTIAGAAAGDILEMLPPATLNDDLIYCGVGVTGANTVTVYLYNPTAGAIDDTAKTWTYLYFDTT